MSIELKDFLIEILEVINPFRDTVTSLLLRNKNNKTQAAAKARDGTISIEISAKNEIEQFTDIACLGSLSYLQSILKSSFMKEGKLELHYDESSQKDKIALKYIQMNGNDGFSAFYQSTDPFINQFNRIKTPGKIDYPVRLVIDNDFIKKFEEMNKIHQASVKTNSAYDEVFRLIYSNGVVGISFGDRGQEIGVDFEDHPVIDSYEYNVNLYLNIEQFRQVTKIINFNNSGILLEFNETSAKFTSASSDKADYIITLVGKKINA